jgi:hypothetical protein
MLAKAGIQVYFQSIQIGLDSGMRRNDSSGVL